MSAYGTLIPIITKGFRKTLSVAHQFAHHSKREYTLPRLHPGKDVAVRRRLKPCDPRPDLDNASFEHGNAFEFFADALAGDPPLDAAGPGCTGERAIDHHGMERIADFRPALQFAPLAFLGREPVGDAAPDLLLGLGSPGGPMFHFDGVQLPQ